MSIEQWQASAPAIIQTAQDQAVQRLTEWAQSAAAAHEVATSLAQSAFVPQQFRGKPVELTAAILSGLEVGLSPMASMRAFDIIQGQAAPRAITLAAIAQSHGHEIELVESTANRCIVRGRRKGSSEWQRVSWTMDRARDLGLTSRDGWKKQPTAMLVARARSEMARLIASDAILGIAYSAEELADGGLPDDAPAVAREPAQSSVRRMSRRPAGIPESEVSGDLPEPHDDRDHKGQRSAMFAAFRDAGFVDARTEKGRADRLDYCAQVIGRAVESTNDMTWDERGAVIDALKADTQAMAEPDALPDPGDGRDPWKDGAA